MLLPPAVLRAIADGTVTLAYRRWERPRVRPGGRQKTAVGVLAFDAVEPVAREEIGEDDARAAGFTDRSELLRFLDRRVTGTIYRIQLRLAGPDPRVALRASVPDDEQIGEIRLRLARLDRASRDGAWTTSVLRLIDAGPGVRAAELAARLGRETRAFKIDVRKLKELGLPESLPRGYRLSPRGRAVLDALSPGRATR
jgi:hypothetical protein